MEASKSPSKIYSWEIDDSEENVAVSTKCKVCHVDFKQSTIKSTSVTSHHAKQSIQMKKLEFIKNGPETR